MFYLWEYLKTVNKPIVLYGMGNGADLICRELSRLGVKVSGVFASDGFAKNKLYKCMPVTDYLAAKNKFGNMVILVAFGSSRPEVTKNVLKIGSVQELYIPDVPVYGDNIFNRDFVNKNAENIEKVYNLLADQKSREIYESIVSFKCSGKMEYIFSAETDYNDDFKLLGLNNTASYLDLGAFNGDTALDFANRVNNYNKIIAVEPDPKTFKKLILNTEGLKNITCINKGIWCSDTEIPFLVGGGRNTAASKGNNKIPVTSVDSILKGEKIDFIKMDVEGSESMAIMGAEKTLKNYRPKMQIACYHRSEDIFGIPLQVLSFRDDYKVYIRHQPCFPAWDTNFYFV